MVVYRRSFLALLGAGSAVLVVGGEAEASVARSIGMTALIQKSRSVVLGTPLAAHSEWAEIGGSRRIVTLTRVRVDEHIARSQPDGSEVLVRTLGGRVGDLGQLVHGEAELRANETCMLFLHEGEPGLSSVTAMAQGHYPLVADSRGRWLKRSPGLAKLVMAPDAAVERLSGQTIDAARRLVRQAEKP
jgi:hypothetical protein